MEKVVTRNQRIAVIDREIKARADICVATRLHDRLTNEHWIKVSVEDGSINQSVVIRLVVIYIDEERGLLLDDGTTDAAV